MLIVALVCALLAFAVALIGYLDRTVWSVGQGGYRNGTVSHLCPACRRLVTVPVGGEVRCRGCGTAVICCVACRRLARATDAGRDAGDGRALCAYDAARQRWKAEQMRAFDTDEERRPVPDTRRAVAARHLYEARIREARRSGVGADEDGQVFAFGREMTPEACATTPASVQEAAAFYERAAERDGVTDVFRWEEAGSGPLFVVRCVMEDEDGWAELYAEDGTPLGYARTRDEIPLWMGRGTARRRALVPEPDETDAELARRAEGFDAER